MKTVLFLLAAALLAQCAHAALARHARHFREHGDGYSLQKVVDLLPPGADSAQVRRLLGEPIDFGFDFRYLIDSTGPGGCPVGAVFHIGEGGKIDQQWLGEICE